MKRTKTYKIVFFFKENYLLVTLQYIDICIYNVLYTHSLKDQTTKIDCKSKVNIDKIRGGTIQLK